jgi:hypothetical protein
VTTGSPWTATMEAGVLVATSKEAANAVVTEIFTIE